MFSVENGLFGLGRNVILRLCRLLWWRELLIRNIFGMGGEIQLWKVHALFLEGRPKNKFLFDKVEDVLIKTGGLNITIHKKKMRCRFLNINSTSAFLNSLIENNSGIFSYSIKIHSHRYSLKIALGAVPQRFSATCTEKFIGQDSGWSFVCYQVEDGRFESTFYGVTENQSISPKETQIKDNSLLSIEVDSGNHTLSFFVNRKKVPRIVTLIAPRVFLGTSGFLSPSFEIINYLLLPRATPSLVACTMHRSKWR